MFILAALTGYIGTSHAASRSVQLKEFQSTPGPFRFTGLSSRHDIYVPLYGLEELHHIEVTLAYTNSVALLPRISQISVMADDFTVGQKSLSPSTPQGRLRVSIPAELLLSDAMRLSIKVEQHYNPECEAPTAGMLWTEVDPLKSHITFVYSGRVERPDMRHWIAMFSTDNPFLSKAAVVVPENGLQWLKCACSAVSWLGSLRKYRPLTIVTAHKLVPGMPNIIMGPQDFVQTVLDNAVKPLREKEPEKDFRVEIPEDTQGPAIGTVMVPQLESNAVFSLVITGRDASDILFASRQAGTILSDYPENQWVFIDTKFSTPSRPYQRQCLSKETEYTFSRLGLTGNMNFTGLEAGEQGITVYVPPEMFRQENRYAQLALDFVYSAGLREDSVLHIKVNGTLAGSIPLNNPEGKTYVDYLTNIPMSFFRGGHNRLSFRAVMKPLQAQKCAPLSTSSMVTTILASSTIKLPDGFSHYDLPSLSLVQDDMFPYSMEVEKGTRPIMVVPEHTDSTIFQAAVNFCLFFAKKLDTPYNQLEISASLPQEVTTNSILIGTPRALPDTVASMLPLLGNKYLAKYRLPWKDLEILRARNELHDSRLMLSQFEYPDGSTKTALVITATKADTIDRGIRRLLTNPPALSEDTVLFDVKTGAADAYHFNRHFHTGRLGLQGTTGNWLTSRPEYYYTLLAALVIVTGLTAYLLIRRRNRIRLEESEDY